MTHRLNLLILSLLLFALPLAASGPESVSIPEGSLTPIEESLPEDLKKGDDNTKTSEHPAMTSVTETHQLDKSMEPNHSVTSGASCVDPRCAYDFLCYEDCSAQWCGPSGCAEGFCDCVQSCVLFCA